MGEVLVYHLWATASPSHQFGYAISNTELSRKGSNGGSVATALVHGGRSRQKSASDDTADMGLGWNNQSGQKSLDVASFSRSLIQPSSNGRASVRAHDALLHAFLLQQFNVTRARQQGERCSRAVQTLHGPVSIYSSPSASWITLRHTVAVKQKGPS
jgi:hypothetical protein